MNTRDNSRFPLVIAHRGASAMAPENTLTAFQLALDQKADGIELDVMLSADKALIVIHDETVDRTTDGQGKVPLMSLAELKGFNAAAHFKEPWKSLETLPLLEEVFELVGGKMLINVELKNFTDPFNDLTQRVISLIEKFSIEESTILSSFNPFNLNVARKANPKIRRGLLTEGGKRGALLRGFMGRFFPYDALHPYHGDVSMDMVRLMHAKRKQVNPWTVDTPQDLLRLKDLGVDMIITNDPLNTRRVLFG
ncbi:MAG: glycerophosphodiester phosphodiesterase family protein [Anaerolineaceae bacterium]|nr:glycerophosphodiester phosphodiesterase family protein [Anaerolineaceae bacterium]